MYLKVSCVRMFINLRAGVPILFNISVSSITYLVLGLLENRQANFTKQDGRNFDCSLSCEMEILEKHRHSGGNPP